MEKSIKKVSVRIDSVLYNDIKDFCDINNIKIDEFIEKHLREDLSNEKWGDAPFLRKKNVIKDMPIIEEEVKSPVVKTYIIEKEEVDDPQKLIDEYYDDNAQHNIDIVTEKEEDIKKPKKRRLK